ncbi:tetratricopeptide repeat-containing sensor histidine kinase [Rasiella sp. SM2506]|uniref:tetratricopeptide repeat-containing sensor histidine kinase n=1 Tax=Rasiella sp. SM2506 TaxID=3423914 RepID=UPI003D7C1266
MKKLLLFIIYISFPIAFSQEEDTDQLIEELKSKIRQTENTERLKWMDSLSNYIAYDTNFENDSIVRATIAYAIKLDSFNIATWQVANQIYYLNAIEGTPLKAKQVFLKALENSGNVDDPNVLCKYFYEGGNTYFYLGEYEKSLQHYDSTFIYAEKAQNNRFIGLSKMGKGQVYTDMGDFGNASLALQDAIKFFATKQDSTSIVEAKNSLSILYSKNGFYEEAEAERNEVIASEIAGGFYNTLPAVYYNAAADYHKMNREADRIASLKLSLDASRKSDYKGYYEPIMLTGIIAAYAENDSLQKAQFYLDELYVDREKNTTGPYKEFYLDAIKNVAFAKKEYTNAIAYGTEYLELKRQGNQYEEIQTAEKFLAKVYTTIGNKDQAFDHYIRYSNIKDSIESAQKVRVLSYYQTIYETEKRDLKIQAQKSDIALLNEKEKVRSQWYIIGIVALLGIFGAIVLARARNSARRRQKLQENFTKDILKTQENERARIAGELHDSIGQKLLMIKNAYIGKEDEAEDEINLVRETIKEVREMSHNLHPFQFEKLRLMKSLKNMVETFQKNSNVFYSEDIDTEDGNIPKEKEIYVFRMLQECLTNVEKHADATACNLSVTNTGKFLVFQLKDNGKGFTIPKNTTDFDGLGMKTLHERAQFIDASFTIDSQPGKGTTSIIKVPKK